VIKSCWKLCEGLENQQPDIIWVFFLLELIDIVWDTYITFDLMITNQIMSLNVYRLEPSKTCSSFISKSFRNDVDSNGINWKSVSNDVRDGYFGEFKV